MELNKKMRFARIKKKDKKFLGGKRKSISTATPSNGDDLRQATRRLWKNIAENLNYNRHIKSDRDWITFGCPVEGQSLLATRFLHGVAASKSALWTQAFAMSLL